MILDGKRVLLVSRIATEHDDAVSSREVRRKTSRDRG